MPRRVLEALPSSASPAFASRFDDFGTAYSSLDYLRRFPIDVIKLDKSFTDDFPGGERGLDLAKAVGRLAADMGAVAEAEGIETEEQASCLQSLG